MRFPPSQVRSNLTTNGQDFVTTDGVPYAGFYWELKGKAAYTGKTPESAKLGDQRLLLPYDDGTFDQTMLGIPFFKESIDNKTIDPYGTISSFTLYEGMQSRRIPIATIPQLTDYQKKLIRIKRFFLKRNGTFEYMEIDEATFNHIENKTIYAWDLYSYKSCYWFINGEESNVETANKDTILNIERPKLPVPTYNEPWAGFSQYFNQNYLQYYQGVKENRTTTGGKYKTKDNKEYSGSYHIHPEKGPMVGATHVDTPHEYLYPINSKIPMDVTSSIQQSTPSQNQYNMSSSPNSTFQGGGSSGGGGY
jgi:hypothetical protein